MRELILSIALALMVLVLLIVTSLLFNQIALGACARGETFEMYGKTYACVEQPPPD